MSLGEDMSKAIPPKVGCRDESPAWKEATAAIGPQGPALQVMPFAWECLGAQAGFTGRAGGVSEAPYQSLNLSFGRRDDPGRVVENHRRGADALGCSLNDMVRVRQVHGARVAVVTRGDAGIRETVCQRLDGVDALVTNDPGLVLLTTHADCVPVYFLDPSLGVIALAHAGWGGVLAGVVEGTIHAMRTAFGCEPGSLQIGIGPHIRDCCFAVREDVIRPFEAMPWWQPEFLTARQGAAHIDLSGCIRAILQGCGVPATQVAEQADCTCCLSSRYFSHRGSGGHTGTGAAWLRRLPQKDDVSTLLQGRKGKAGIALLCALLALTLTLVFAGCAQARGGADVPPPSPVTAVGTPGASGAPESSSTMEPPVAAETPVAPETTAATEPSATPGVLSGMGNVLLEDTGPGKGGTLRLFMLPDREAMALQPGAAPDMLNPLVSMNPEVVDCGWFLSDPLVTVLDNGTVRPLVAARLKSSQDGRVWDIFLREQVLFHDGAMLEGRDVAVTLERAAASNGVFAAGLRNLEKVEVVSRQQVRIILKAPDPRFTRQLQIPIFSADSWKIQQKPLQEVFTPIGLGAFSLASHDAEGVTLVRHDGWWQQEAGTATGHPAWPDEVRFLYGRSEADRLSFFQQRRIDAAWTVEADVSQYQNRSDIEVRTFPGSRMEFALVGAKSRQLQRQPIREILLRYLAGLRPEVTLAGDLVSDTRFLPLTAEEVIPLLEAEGCRYRQKGDSPPVLSIPGTDGLRTAAFGIHYNALSVERLNAAQWLSEALAPIGITCYLQEVTINEAQSLAASGRFDLLLLGGDFPVGLADGDMISEMRQVLPPGVAELVPLYRERRAMLYHTRIRGEKQPNATQIYGGWQHWYLLESAVEGANP